MVMNDRLMVFDMDGVLVRPRSSWRIVHDHLGTQNERSYDLYMQGLIDDAGFMRRDIEMWMNTRPGIDIPYLGNLFSSVGIMPGYSSAVRELMDAGFDLIMISGGIDLLSRIIDREGRFREIFSNGLASDSTGRLTGEGILRVPLRDKGAVLKGFLDRNPGYGIVVSVGDSFVDVPLFTSSDLSIAFRPMDEQSSKEADIVIDGEDLQKVSDAVVEWL